jgi:arginyl-tRNA synthetase
MMLKYTIAELLKKAVAGAQNAGKLPAADIPEIVIERPQKPEHGDYAASVALKLTKTMRMKPMDIAKEIVASLEPAKEIDSAYVAPPGFINFRLKDAWLSQQVDTVMAAGYGYGNTAFGQGKKVNIEFVSVNPTGPLHVGNARGGVLGSTLCNVMAAAGYAVTREYYFNDAGSQMDAFRQSLFARYQQALGQDVPFPENGYHGQYMIDLGKEVAEKEGDRYLKLPEAERLQELGKTGMAKLLEGTRKDLKDMRVDYDVWYSEKTLYQNGQFDTVMKLLKEKGFLIVKDGATWFASSNLGEDKDNVVVRSNGSPTYFAADIAYHYNKFIERGFDQAIDIWGADHAGHVSRMKAVVSVFGVDPKRLEIIINQMVTLRRGGEVVRISKRTGDIITLRELLDEVGPDACRFILLSRTADSQMDFDLELAKKQSSENPVYYVQYAHARIASILKVAGEKGASADGGDVSLLTHESELTLIRKMLQLPEMVENIAASLEPHHLTYYAQDLATDFHAFYKNCRVVNEDDPKLTSARLKLVKAAKIVLGRTLNLMGMDAPEKM